MDRSGSICHFELKISSKCSVCHSVPGIQITPLSVNHNPYSYIKSKKHMEKFNYCIYKNEQLFCAKRPLSGIGRLLL